MNVEVHLLRVGGVSRGGRKALTIGMGITVINHRIGKKTGVASREERVRCDWEVFHRATDI